MTTTAPRSPSRVTFDHLAARPERPRPRAVDFAVDEHERTGRGPTVVDDFFVDCQLGVGAPR